MQKLSKCISVFLGLFMLCPLVFGMERGGKQQLTDQQLGHVIGNQPYRSSSATPAWGPLPPPSPSDVARQLAEEKKRNDELAQQIYNYGKYCKETGKPPCVIN